MTVIEVLEELDIPYLAEGHEHCRPGWYQVDCPDCTPAAQHWRLGVNAMNGASSCWACGRKDTARTLADISGRPLGEVIGLLRGLRGAVRGKDHFNKDKLVIPEGVGPLLPAHRQYLQNRGIDPDQAAEVWSVRGIGQAVRLSWRLFMPVHYEGQVVSWTTRKIKNGPGTRYITASKEQERFSSKEVLFGGGLARSVILICEGPLDAIRVGPGAVATMGTSYTKSQVLQMANFPVRYVCFDQEPVAQRQARELAQDLSVFGGTTHNVVLESGKDPGECSRKELKQLRRLLQ